MHTEGVDEHLEGKAGRWLVRWACGCGRRVGAVMPAEQAPRVVDRLLWTSDARHALERLLPHIQTLIQPDVEDRARAGGGRVITEAALTRVLRQHDVPWDPEAERRMEKVPAAVRAMARLELERAAVERGEPCVTVGLMEEVKARYFGLFRPEPSGPSAEATSGLLGRPH